MTNFSYPRPRELWLSSLPEHDKFYQPKTQVNGLCAAAENRHPRISEWKMTTRNTTYASNCLRSRYCLVPEVKSTHFNTDY